MASKPHPVPFVKGYVPGTPKPKKEKSWADELNEIGNFLLGPHGSQLFSGLEAAAEFTPGAAVRDTMDASKTVSEGVMNLNPWETGMGIAGLLTGFLPGKSKATEFDLIHGTRHDFAPTEKNPIGEFDLSKVLTGEGTNYEGKGIYATQPKAQGLGTSYAHTGVDNELLIMLGDKRSSDILKELKDKEGQAGANTADKLDALSKLEEIAVFNNTNSKLKFTDDHIDKILESMSEPDPKTGMLWAPPENVIDFLNSFRDKEATIREPGGFIYDFKVHDSPDNFINMHLPIAYQDDKVITAVDEWLKNMPLSDKQRREFMPIDGKHTDQGVRDYLRKKFIDDEYFIPKEDMSRILQNEYVNEHMDIIKDQGVLGQKWFGRHKDGGRHRDSVARLFNDLAVVDNATTEGIDGLDLSRKEIEKKIYNLETKIENIPITDSNMNKIMGWQSTVNELNTRLMNMTGPEDIAEKLWKIYNDPNLAYNFTINDPKKTTLVKKTFIPK